MIPPSPIHQPLPVVIVAPSGYITGMLHLPPMKNLRAYLNGPEEILKLTDARLPGRDQTHPFLALQKSATLLLVPQAGMDTVRPEPTSIPKTRRPVTCLLTVGSLRAFIEAPESLRTSDFLLRSPGFLEFLQCHFSPNPYMDASDARGDPFPLVFVNGRSVVGVTEENPG